MRKANLVLLLGVAALATTAFATDHESVLYNFAGSPDGATPNYLVMDAAGNIYGATFSGGSANCPYGGCGVIFELSKLSGHWIEQVLYTFTNSANDGAYPTGITLDASGNIYGFTSGHGFTGGAPGTAFKLTLHSGTGWKFSLLYRFGLINNGAVYPNAAPLLDSAGNLYGTSLAGGGSTTCTGGCGTAFKLSPTPYGYYAEDDIYAFSNVPDALVPSTGLISDSAGNMYGASWYGGTNTSTCGSYGCGTVFELSPSGGGWSESVIASFNGYPGDVQGPRNGIAMDSKGNIFGSSYSGGNVTNSGCYGTCGGVYEVSPVAGGGWAEKLIHSFNYTTEGALPSVGVTVDAAGNVYGLTSVNPNTLAGTVYELSSDAAGQWKITILYTLGTQNGDGQTPQGSAPVLDSSGNLYGQTSYSGAHKNGNIFKVSPSNQ